MKEVLMISDEGIIALLDSRSENVLKILFDCYAPKLAEYLRKWGATDREAKSVLYKTFMTIWKSDLRFDPHEISLTNWIYRIAKETAESQFELSQRLKYVKDRKLIEGKTFASEPSEKFAFQLVSV